ncbi:hypothetical protein [Aquimarina algiphila]|uniref:hypothetical protein n=1 Tax=Aquimarina algiphila TaxID=2047982 RepID=UPI0024933E88|nr:hypothetical protein [Aquimarina algiphila]
MKRFLSIIIFIVVSYQCNSQSLETALYIREELVKQRDDLLKQVRELQTKIDAIDRKLGTKNTSNTETKYLTKTVKYDSETRYSNSLEKNSSQNRQSRSRTTRTYHRGPRGGCYYINSNGNKTYVARSMCN